MPSTMTGAAMLVISTSGYLSKITPLHGHPRRCDTRRLRLRQRTAGRRPQPRRQRAEHYRRSAPLRRALLQRGAPGLALPPWHRAQREGSACIGLRNQGANDRIYWQRNRLTPAEPLQHHAHTLTCRHAGEFQIVAGENVPGSLTFSFWPRVKKSLFGNRIGPLISFLRSSSTTMSATDAGLSSDIANTARLRGCALPFC